MRVEYFFPYRYLLILSLLFAIQIIIIVPISLVLYSNVIKSVKTFYVIYVHTCTYVAMCVLCYIELSNVVLVCILVVALIIFSRYLALVTLVYTAESTHRAQNEVVC